MRTQIERAFHALVLDRRALLGAAAGAAILLPSAAYAERAEPAGSVEDIRGEAFAEARAQRRQLAQAAPLFINDLVGTGPASRLTLQLGKNTTLRVGSEARLTLDRLLVNAGGEITLQSGPTPYDRPAASAPARMQIRSSFGLIAVRGTASSPGRALECSACSSSAAASRFRLEARRWSLRAGHGTNIADRGAAPTRPAPCGRGAEFVQLPPSRPARWKASGRHRHCERSSYRSWPGRRRPPASPRSPLCWRPTCCCRKAGAKIFARPHSISCLQQITRSGRQATTTRALTSLSWTSTDGLSTRSDRGLGRVPRLRRSLKLLPQPNRRSQPLTSSLPSMTRGRRDQGHSRGPADNAPRATSARESDRPASSRPRLRVGPKRTQPAARATVVVRGSPSLDELWRPPVRSRRRPPRREDQRTAHCRYRPTVTAGTARSAPRGSGRLHAAGLRTRNCPNCPQGVYLPSGIGSADTGDGRPQSSPAPPDGLPRSRPAGPRTACRPHDFRHRRARRREWRSQTCRRGRSYRRVGTRARRPAGDGYRCAYALGSDRGRCHRADHAGRFPRAIGAAGAAAACRRRTGRPGDRGEQALPPILGALAVAAMIPLTWMAAIATALLTDRLLDPLPPSVAVATVFVIASVISFAVTQRREVLVRRRFEQHLAPAVVQRIVEQPDPCQAQRGTAGRAGHS